MVLYVVLYVWDGCMYRCYFENGMDCMVVCGDMNVYGRKLIYIFLMSYYCNL